VKADDDSNELRRSLRLLQRRLAWVIIPAVLASVAAYFLSGLREDQFRATADVRVVDPTAGSVIGEQSSAATGLREVTTQVEVASSPGVRAAADERVGESTAAQVTDITISAVEDSDLIRITATATSAEAAAAAANGLAEVYVEIRGREITDRFAATATDYRAKATELDQQADLANLALSSEPPDSVEAERLRTQRADLERQSREFDASAREYELEAALRADAISIVNPAAVPEGPFAPAPVRDAALAGLLTAVAAVGVVFLLDRLDRKVRTKDDLRQIPDAPPVLGVVPDLTARRRGGGRSSEGPTDPDTILTSGSAQAEAFRRLRSAVWLEVTRNKALSLVITSSKPSEGKSLVSANLAVSLALSGVRVALVSADLRAPRAGTYFGVDETGPGLTDVLSGTSRLADVARSIRIDDHTVTFIPAGSPPFDPGMLLGSEQMAKVLNELEEGGCELVLLDSAPVGPVGDTIDLARNVDGALVVVRSGEAVIDHVADVVDRIRETDTPVAGFVLNGVDRSDETYGYGYGYGYGSTDSARPRRSRR